MEAASFVASRESISVDVWDANFARRCAEWDVPLISLEKLGIFSDRDGYLESKELMALTSGAEARPYHDLKQGVVYKLFDLRENGSLGMKCEITRISDEEGPEIPEENRYRVGKVEANLRDTLIKLALLNEVGAHPTEIVGLSDEADFLVVKQPFASPAKDPEGKDLHEAIAQTKAVKPRSLRLNGVFLWFQGDSYIMADLHKNNIMIDHDGFPTIIDALVGRIPPLLIDRLPAFHAAVDDAEDLRKGRPPRNRYDLLDVRDDELWITFREVAVSDRKSSDSCYGDRIKRMDWRLWCRGSACFEVEEISFAVEAAAVADEGAVFADDAVAGDDDGDGVFAVGEADGSGGGGFADGGGLGGVAEGFAVGDFGEGVPG